MALNIKDSPTGEDKIVDVWQKALYDGLTERGWTNYESYHRVYKNIDEDFNVNPMRHLINNDMDVVPMNDRTSVTSFFLISDESEEINGLTESVFSVIFQVDLNKLYGERPHRFDAELINDIKAINRNLDGRFKDEGISRGIDNVYKEFDTDLIKKELHDKQPYNVVRFDMTVRYDNFCGDVYATSGVACNISVTTSFTSPSIFGGIDGTASATVTNNNGAFTYFWTTLDGVIPSGQEDNQTMEGLVAGTYSVLVTDSIPVNPVCSASSSIEVENPSEPSLKLYWIPSLLSSMNGGSVIGDLLSTIVDQSGSGNDGASSAPFQPEITGTSLDIVSGDFVSTSSSDLVFTSDFTISCKFVPDITNNQGIVTRWSSSTNNRAYQIAIFQGRYQFFVSSNGTGFASVDSGISAVIGEENYVCAGYNATTQEIFISSTPTGGAGVNAFAELSHTTGIFAGNADFIYGKNDSLNSDGKALKVRAYSQIRSITQCLAEYNDTP